MSFHDPSVAPPAPRRAQCGRFSRLPQMSQVAERLIREAEPDGYASVLSFCAAHPSLYMAAAVANGKVTTRVAERLPYADKTESASWRLNAVVRVVARGVSINVCHHADEPLAAATTHLQLLRSLAASAGVPLAVQINGMDDDATVRALVEWDAALSAPPDTVQLFVRGSAALREATRACGGRPLRLFECMRSVEVAVSRKTSSSATLQGIGALQRLEELHCHEGVAVQSLAPLANLQCLVRFSCAGAPIGDADVRVLAGLPNLVAVSVEGCGSVTTLEPLADLRRLRDLNATGCGRLSRVAGLGSAPSLRRLDLSGCQLLTGEETGRFFLSAASVSQLSLVGVRMPEYPPPPTAPAVLLPGLRFLNLARCRIRTGWWLARMPYVEQLRLSSTSITEAVLKEMFTPPVSKTEYCVEVLALERCENLHTSLEVALSLPFLSMVSISASSLAPSNAVEALRAQGKDISVW